MRSVLIAALLVAFVALVSAVCSVAPHAALTVFARSQSGLLSSM